MFTRSAAHKVRNLHVPHSEGQIRAGAFVSNEPFRLRQHTVENSRHTFDLGAVADFGRLRRLAVDLLMKEVEPEKYRQRLAVGHMHLFVQSLSSLLRASLPGSLSKIRTLARGLEV